MAEACETMLTDTDAAQRIGKTLQAKDATLFEKVKQWFRDLAAKLREAYKNLKPDSEIAQGAEKTIQQVDGLVQLWADMAVDAAENYRTADGEKNTILEGGEKYSIRKTEDGTKYVVLDGNLFVDKNGKPLSPKQAYNALVGQKIVLEDGDVITFVKNLPGIEMYKELFKKFPGYDGSFDIVAINWEINKNILDVFAGSSVQKRNEPQRHYHYGISNFDQRQVYITDGNEVYRLELNIANLTDGKKVAYVKRYIERADNVTA